MDYLAIRIGYNATKVDGNGFIGINVHVFIRCLSGVSIKVTLITLRFDPTAVHNSSLDKECVLHVTQLMEMRT